MNSQKAHQCCKIPENLDIFDPKFISFTKGIFMAVNLLKKCGEMENKCFSQWGSIDSSLDNWTVKMRFVKHSFTFPNNFIHFCFS